MCAAICSSLSFCVIPTLGCREGVNLKVEFKFFSCFIFLVSKLQMEDLFSGGIESLFSFTLLFLCVYLQ